MDMPNHSDGTVGKALCVLDAVAKFAQPVRFTQLLEVTPFPKPTLYRYLQTLVSQNMLQFDSHTSTYSLGPRLLQLAHVAWQSASLAPIARSHIERLAQRVGQAVHLAQLDNGQVMFVDKLVAQGRVQTLAQIGQVAPAYCTGVGKAMLAFIEPGRLEIVLQQQSYFRYTSATHANAQSLRLELDQIRSEGVAFDRQEHQTGINSLAAPILSQTGRVMGALSIATFTSLFDCEGLRAFEDDLLDTAAKIGKDASAWHLPT